MNIDIIPCFLDPFCATGLEHTPATTHFIATIFGWRIGAGHLLALGFTGQALFTARVIVQVLASHRRGESYVPAAFWYLSFAAGLALIAYYFVRSDPVLLLQQAMMVPIHARNIYFIQTENGTNGRRALLMRILLVLVCLACAVCLAGTWATSRPDLENVADPASFVLPLIGTIVPAWLLLGFGYLGMAVFNGRFVAQWIASERRKRSVVPVSFWVMASIGSVMLLIYAIVRSDPVAIVGYAFTLAPFLYNLALIRRSRVKNNACLP